jgi:hypothetical protein
MQGRHEAAVFAALCNTIVTEFEYQMCEVCVERTKCNNIKFQMFS